MPKSYSRQLRIDVLGEVRCDEKSCLFYNIALGIVRCVDELS